MSFYTLARIERAKQANPTHWLDRSRRIQDRWLRVQDRATALIDALIAWRDEKSRLPPDGGDVAEAIASVTSHDDGLRVADLYDFQDAQRKAQALGKVLGAIVTEYASRPDLIADYLRDCRRFDRDFADAWNEYVDA